nr:Chain E, MP-1 [synthetic construct]1HY2_F Chain F, MP-1 [synthetic construct]1HY2_G Chain G, MP-1 [synthetic construct]1HY2_H Chain H, MP-1 [synthetic construct]
CCHPQCGAAYSC